MKGRCDLRSEQCAFNTFGCEACDKVEKRSSAELVASALSKGLICGLIIGFCIGILMISLIFFHNNFLTLYVRLY